MTDYSQAGEQAVILSHCSAEQGTFLDIGAWNPRQFSNTRALFELGWSGVCIEPSPGPMLALLEDYGAHDDRVSLVQAAVGLESGVVLMHISNDAVSTSSAEVYRQWQHAAKFLGNVVVPTITLEQIFNQFGGFDFVNIDAEGLSADLFLHMLTLGVYPPCVCVEHDGRTTELMSLAGAQGYAGRVIGANLIIWR